MSARWRLISVSTSLSGRDDEQKRHQAGGGDKPKEQMAHLGMPNLEIGVPASSRPGEARLGPLRVLADLGLKHSQPLLICRPDVGGGSPRPRSEGAYDVSKVLRSGGGRESFRFGRMHVLGASVSQAGSAVGALRAPSLLATVTPDKDCGGASGVTVTSCPIRLTKHSKRGIVVTVSGPGVVSSNLGNIRSCFSGQVCYKVQRKGGSQTEWRKFLRRALQDGPNSNLTVTMRAAFASAISS